MYELTAEAFFDSAHFLADYHGKCENLHGHRWRIVATISADKLQEAGNERDMVCDFSDFKQAIKDIADEFDHTFLIEDGTLMPETIKCLQSEEFSLTILPYRTTAENIAKHIYDKLIDKGFNVSAVEVDETPNNRATYRP